jgi:hypothetical protein
MHTTFGSFILIAASALTAMSVQISTGLKPVSVRFDSQRGVKVRLTPTEQQPPNSVRDLKVTDAESAVAVMKNNELRVCSRTAEPLMFHSGQAGAPEQRSDLDFNPRVGRPAYPNRRPKVLFDEAHNNSDTSSGRYRPFTDMIASDGYNVMPGTEGFSQRMLNPYAVLIIVNASGPQGHRETSAFTEGECNAVRDWVGSGGALLLITDHAPFSVAAAQLSKRFGVDLTNGYTIDTVHYNKDSGDQTELVFSRDDGLIREHSITKGRNESERINRVITFTGTSLKGPEKSVAFLKLADTAIDVLPPERKPALPNEQPADHKTVSAAGRAQGIALEFGKGRVVVLGEAAMLTSQVTPQGLRFGINFSDTDNRQLALNIMHWLSGLLK